MTCMILSSTATPTMQRTPDASRPHGSQVQFSMIVPKLPLYIVSSPGSVRSSSKGEGSRCTERRLALCAT